MGVLFVLLGIAVLLACIVLGLVMKAGQERYRALQRTLESGHTPDV
jgi:hypothetical protein